MVLLAIMGIAVFINFFLTKSRTFKPVVLSKVFNYYYFRIKYFFYNF